MLPFRLSEGPLYVIYFIQDYTEKESVIMLKAHHSLVDGLSA